MYCAVGNLLRETGPNLYHFMWWRLVCDEAHEMMVYDYTGPSEGLKTVVGFQSRFRWYVSGTPFPRGMYSLRAALQVLHMLVVCHLHSQSVSLLCHVTNCCTTV